MKAGEHGPDELYDKFHVYKTKSLIVTEEYDKGQVNGDLNAFDKNDRLGNNGEFIFVLRPETNDKAAQEALETYARMCEFSYPELSAQIVSRLTQLRKTILSLREEGLSEDDAYRELKELRNNGTRWRELRRNL